MHDGEHRPDAAVGPTIGRKYTSASSSRRRSSGSARRRFFFGLASIWGFLTGVVGLLAVTGGKGLASGAGALPVLIPALLVAGAGGLVMSAAYSESKRRSR